VLLPIKNGRACAQPEAVTRGHLARGQQELLVQWRGQPAAEATWMDHQEFQRLYPDFQLEDELLAKGGGGEMSWSIFHYAWRRRVKQTSAGDATTNA
jgi:hypothetical protein